MEFEAFLTCSQGLMLEPMQNNLQCISGTELKILTLGSCDRAS